MVKTLPFEASANQLLLEGSEALAIVEANGFCIDEEYLGKATRRVERKIDNLLAVLKESDVGKEWRKVYGPDTNYGSDTQLGKVLFDHMGYTSPGKTEKSLKHKTDEESLSSVDHPFVKDYLTLKALKKTHSTYLKGIQAEIVDGKVHCFFNLHNVSSFRSSSTAPNLQNITVRDEEQGKIVRQMFVPRSGGQLVEIDLGGAEVRTMAAYTQDQVLIDYILDPDKDMHRDQVAQIYCLPIEEAQAKQIRYCGKNMFVFPEFYGSWFKPCGVSLWKAAHTLSLADKTPLPHHLANKGLDNVEAFLAHMERVERKFWNTFQIFAAWKEKWINQYRKRGWVKMLSGFICHGPLSQNQIINYPVQGTSFHHLLWVLNRLVLKELPRREMRTLVIGEVHDSIIFDCPTEELNDLLTLVKAMFIRCREEWATWLPVPLEAECKVSKVREEGGSWWKMEKREL